MKPINSVTILATFIAIAGVQGRSHSSTGTTSQDVDRITTTGSATGTDASGSMTDTTLSIATDSATDSASADFRTLSSSRTDSDASETPTGSGIDPEATSTWDDDNTDTWTDDGFTATPYMIASPPTLTPIAGTPTTYASTSMFPSATPIANPSLAKFNNAGSRIGMLSSEWLVLGLIGAVAAILL